MIIDNRDLWVRTFSLASFTKHRHCSIYSSKIEDHGLLLMKDTIEFMLLSYVTISIYLLVQERWRSESPSSVAPVCQAGDQLELTCESSVTIHRWELVHCSPRNMTYATVPVFISWHQWCTPTTDFQQLHNHFLEALCSR